MTEELTLDGLISSLRRMRKEHPTLGDAIVTGPGCTGCSHRAFPLDAIKIDTYDGEPSIRIKGAGPWHSTTSKR